MDVYILDSLLRRRDVIDLYESFIWTERWRALGDFEMILDSNQNTRGMFVVDTHLAILESDRVMRVETVEDKTDADGREVLEVKGRSIEAVLEDRVAKEQLATSEPEEKWVLNGTPADIARQMFDHICRPPAALNPNDTIPFLMPNPGGVPPAGGNPEPSDTIRWEQEPASLYSAIREICVRYDLGFRLRRNGDTSELYFEIYTGTDRTTQQTVLPPVVFSVGFDSIQNTTEFASVQGLKNVAYVVSDQGFAVVYGNGATPEVEGFDRRVMVVNAFVEEDVSNVQAFLTQQGREALNNQRASSIFDGEVDHTAQYVYGEHYNLGDMVEMRNRDGEITRKRVTEQIFVSDANGVRTYPTLSLGLFTTTDAWRAYANRDVTWADMTTEVWADM